MNYRFSFYNTAAATEHYLGIHWPRYIWAAVLQQAIEDLHNGVSLSETEGMSPERADEYVNAVYDAALEWVIDEANEPRRFVWVCEQLGLDAKAVRASVLKGVRP